MESTETRVLRTIRPFAQCELKMDTRIADAGMDSLSLMCATQACMDEFNCNVRDEEFRVIQTVGDIVSLFQPAEIAQPAA